MGGFPETIYQHKYAWPGEQWPDTARRVVQNVMGPYLPELVDEMTRYIKNRWFMPGGRYLYASGKRIHQTQNCLLTTVEDSKEAIADLMRRANVGLMTGAGLGNVWSKLRPAGAAVRGMGGVSTGPIAFANMLNETGRYIVQGGSRRAAIWGGLHWWHPDIFDWIVMKNWSDDIKALKEKDFSFPAPMDQTNISVILDDEFKRAYDDPGYTPPDWYKFEEEYGIERGMTAHEWAHKVYWLTVEQMLTTAEPGFSVDMGQNAGENLRNACTEITSADDNDICNLGSINLARIPDIETMRRVVEVSTAFLLCGTLYSTLPYAEVEATRTKNRRLGLGLMGIYEWLLTRGYRYGPNAELATWLHEYTQSTRYSWYYADKLGISRPVKTRAIAPTGTIAILGETTSGLEPLFAKAFKRRWLKDNVWHFQYVVDTSAKRLLDKGVPEELMEDAYDLAQDPERRVAFQAWLQQFVDHGISSTLNLPARDEQSFTVAEFGDMLYRYLPYLRGVTCYPDGARGGQPITKVPLQEALDWEGYDYVEYGNEVSCVSGVCGA